VGSDDEARAAALAALAVLHRNMDDGRPGLVDRADHRRGISVEYFAVSRRVGDFRQGLALFIQIEHESSPPRHMGRGKVGYQRGGRECAAAQPSACSMSAMRSSTCSMPTERRIRLSRTGLSNPPTVFLPSARLSTPPKDVAGM